MDHAADLMSRQIELEAEMRSLGIDRYRASTLSANERGKSSDRKPARRLIEGSHERILAAIGQFRAGALSGKAGRKNSAIAVFDVVADDDLLAHLALRQVMDRIGERPNLVATALSLAGLIEDELFYRTFAEQLPAAYKATIRKVEDKPHAGYKRASTRITGSKLGVEFEGWDTRTKLLVGAKLLELVVETTGLVTVEKVSSGPRHTVAVLVASPETLAWLETEDGRSE